MGRHGYRAWTRICDEPSGHHRQGFKRWISNSNFFDLVERIKPPPPPPWPSMLIDVYADWVTSTPGSFGRPPHARTHARTHTHTNSKTHIQTITPHTDTHTLSLTHLLIHSCASTFSSSIASLSLSLSHTRTIIYACTQTHYPNFIHSLSLSLTHTLLCTFCVILMLKLTPIPQIIAKPLIWVLFVLLRWDDCAKDNNFWYFSEFLLMSLHWWFLKCLWSTFCV